MLDGPRDYRFQCTGHQTASVITTKKDTNHFIYTIRQKEKKSSKDLNHYQNRLARSSYSSYRSFLPEHVFFFQADLPPKKPASISSILN